MTNSNWAPTLPLAAITSIRVAELSPAGVFLAYAPLLGWTDENNIDKAREVRPDIKWSTTEVPEAFINLHTTDVLCKVGFKPIQGINYQFTSSSQ